ncbi:MAG: hypothetical protein B7Y45_13255 [Sphingomonas sp. 28-66-16]|nr:MAG: hypothetical protein B7Y45_13255 [Sphingomonas sp. 28-66-16]
MRYLPLFVLALIAGGSFWATHWIAVDAPLLLAWKGAGVALLAVWAALNARQFDGWLLTAVLTFGAIGDVLLNPANMAIGGLAFFIAHLAAIALYARRRGRWAGAAPLIAVAVAAIAWSLPADRGAAAGIAFYALGLGGMAGTALVSRYPRAVSLGAFMFVASDLLIFARLGPLHGSEIADVLIWPLYFGCQALVAWTVVRTLLRRGRVPDVMAVPQ